jgi:putative two-component system response regulator
MVRSARVLIVDDEASHRNLIADVLHVSGYTQVRSIGDPRGVLALLLEFEPDLVILDLRMPYLDGFQVLQLIRSMRAGAHCLPILVITAESNSEARYKALSGGAIDFLLKPFDAREVCLRVRNLLQFRFQYTALQQQNQALEEEVQQRTQELEGYQLNLKEAQLETIQRLARAAEHHDDETAQHTRRVATICTLLGQGLRLDDQQVNLLGRAAPLHDVGKIGIPDSILLKPGLFTDAERKIMRRHCVIGADLLSGGQSELIQAAEQIALTHHEKWDGSGYPHGLSGEDISIHGRILAVADVFDALTHERPYKKAWPLDEVVAEIRAQSGRHFDPAVVDAFMSLPHQRLL